MAVPLTFVIVEMVQGHYETTRSADSPLPPCTTLSSASLPLTSVRPSQPPPPPQQLLLFKDVQDSQ